MDRSSPPSRPARPSRPALTNLGRLPVQNDFQQSPELRQICSQTEGRLRFSTEEQYVFTTDDLIDEGEIGRGNYGLVKRMRHKASGHLLAVKSIRANSVNTKDQKRLFMELEAIMKSDCDYIVRFYGAIFKEQCCFICMELMDISLEKLYRIRVAVVRRPIPEDIMGYITVSTVNALNYLKEQLQIIHRGKDVKPSNILLNKEGYIKLCDFGIAGRLIDSIVKSQDVGCRPYMAPERLQAPPSYDVRSDVWSLGITLYEAANGQFPYSKWKDPFHQLQEVVNGDPPTMKPDNYSISCVTFINNCLIKEKDKRPKYKNLMELDFYKTYNVSGDELIFSRSVVGDIVSKALAVSVNDETRLDSETRQITYARFD